MKNHWIEELRYYINFHKCGILQCIFHWNHSVNSNLIWAVILHISIFYGTLDWIIFHPFWFHINTTTNYVSRIGYPGPEYPLPRLELIMGNLETLVQDTPLPRPPPEIGTSRGGICVEDWCVETTAVSPDDTVSFTIPTYPLLSWKSR